MGVVLDNVDSIWTEGKMVMEIWSGGKLLYQYDNIAPELTIDIAGTSSKSPTYVQSDSVLDYTVTGTVSDADSGVKSVTVNGVAAEIAEDGSWSATLADLATNTTHQITVVAEDNAGNINTVNRYLRCEEYYQQAARIAGATVQSSLVNTLTNSTVCNAIAGNSTACAIMKQNYVSSMSSQLDNAFTTHLNNLNYNCGAKAYIVRNGTSYFNPNWALCKTQQYNPEQGWASGYYYAGPYGNQYQDVYQISQTIFNLANHTRIGAYVYMSSATQSGSNRTLTIGAVTSYSTYSSAYSASGSKNTAGTSNIYADISNISSGYIKFGMPLGAGDMEMRWYSIWVE